MRSKVLDVIEAVLKDIILVMLIMSPFIALYLLDKSEENKAIKRCNGKENIVMKYTKDGDKYFECIKD